MKYISTRGQSPAVSSIRALLNGIAPDGGLYVPERTVPMQPGSDYADTMLRLLKQFFDEIPEARLAEFVRRSVATFRSPEAVPLVGCGNGLYFLELFHGQTFAFKDVALSMLPHLLQYAAEQEGVKRVCILTATSGDTGSAAMNGFAGVKGTNVLVFYPASGISEIQQRQMVCCPANNVTACALEGNFDDAQAGVKRAFADATLRARAEQAGCLISSANSINIGRLIPQICYYLETARKLGQPFDIVVPTGNFGNILAAYYARELGAPIERLTVASNANRVVCDFINTGVYDARREFTVTNSPSMDILVSSNIERLLWILTEGDAAAVRAMETSLRDTGTFTLPEDAFTRMHERFAAGWASPEETEAAIREIKEIYGYTADPHTAIGYKVSKDLPPTGRPTVIAATAAPAKFPLTMVHALLGKTCEDVRSAMALLGGATPEDRIASNLLNAPIRCTDSTTCDGITETVIRTFGL